MTRLVLVAVLGLGGCIRVPAHQRAALAAPVMEAPAWPAITTADDHVFTVREGTGGATGVGGGGCGCN